MCSVTGFISFNRRLPEDVVVALANLLVASKQRGKDGFGCVSFFDTGSTREFRSVPEISGQPIPDLKEMTSIVRCCSTAHAFLANHRAEPTTEYVEKKTIQDQQPYSFGCCHAVHNGTIANDKEVVCIDDPPTKVDSFAIPFSAATRGVRSIMDLRGSQATLLVDQKTGLFYAYRNYRPLRVLWSRRHRLYVFSSLMYAGGFFDQHDFIPLHFPPYSWGENFKRDGTYVLQVFHPENQGKAFVICSGGLDSTVAATVACRDCKDVTLLHFLYGCPAEQREKYAVEKIAQVLGTKHLFIDMGWLKSLGGSVLTDGGPIQEGVAGAEYAYEWVPARNTAMIGIAAAYADRYDVGRIYLGLNLEEGGAYPDNTTEFYERFNQVLDAGTIARPVIFNPLASMTKKEIVRLAYDVGAPIQHSWSCYRGGEKHCGVCGPCVMRRTAHRMLGLQDTVEYER